MTDKRKPKPCPHCGKDTLLAQKPRDLGLLAHWLIFQVPVEEPITEEWLEKARRHCKMKPERLAELRSAPHARHWRYLAEKRERRLAWTKEHGQPPPFVPPAPGERDHTNAVKAMRLHYKKVRPMLAKMKRRPAAQLTKMANAHAAANKNRNISEPSDQPAIYEGELQVALGFKALDGTLSVRDIRRVQEEIEGVRAIAHIAGKAT